MTCPRSASVGFVALAVGCLCACEDGAPGDVAVVVEAESTITDGIPAGAEPDAIVDGWDVHFDRYVVSLGGIALARTGAEVRDDTVRVIDLARVPAGSTLLTRFTGVASGGWEGLEYALVAPTNSARRDDTVSQADFDAMVAGGCTYSIAGTLDRAGGQSCPPGGTCRDTDRVAFAFCVPAPVRFAMCANEEGRPGVVVPSAGSATAALTIHGDHAFFDGFPSDAELLERRAQWLADSDVDGDGLVTRAELESLSDPVEVASLFPSGLYHFSSAPVGALRSAFTYLVAQLSTQGHFQGEGECAYELP